MKKIAILVFAAMALTGCSFIGKKADSPQNVISKEQIYNNLFVGSGENSAKFDVKFRDQDSNDTIYIRGDELGCFAPSGDADKITDSTAEINLKIGVLKYSVDAEYLYGKVLMKYKKENDKWKLENIDMKDLRIDRIPTKMKDEIDKVTNRMNETLCSYYMFAPKK